LIEKEALKIKYSFFPEPGLKLSEFQGYRHFNKYYLFSVSQNLIKTIYQRLNFPPTALSFSAGGPFQIGVAGFPDNKLPVFRKAV